MSLSGKTILVTGASSGIGRAAAICCSKQGARLVITGRSRERLESTGSELAGDGHFVLAQDLTCQEGLEPFFQNIVNETGVLDGLVHCAGIPAVIPIKALSRQKLEQVMAVNFYSFVELVRQFGKKKYSRDGASIIGISAALVRHPRAYELAYISSKAALEAAVPVMAMELRKRRMRVNSVSPGNVRTEMVEKVIAELGNESRMEKSAQTSILGWQTPEEIARVCAFLLGDGAASITACNIQADGGFC